MLTKVCRLSAKAVLGLSCPAAWHTRFGPKCRTGKEMNSKYKTKAGQEQGSKTKEPTVRRHATMREDTTKNWDKLKEQIGMPGRAAKPKWENKTRNVKLNTEHKRQKTQQGKTSNRSQEINRLDTESAGGRKTNSGNYKGQNQGWE